jgi:hypothetical protein
MNPSGRTLSLPVMEEEATKEVCPVCRRGVRVRIDGALYKHDAGSLGIEICEGSGLTPHQIARMVTQPLREMHLDEAA